MTSVFDLFRVGIGPSSSHTVGPMRAARRVLADVRAAGRLAEVGAVEVELHGSLGATGRGHGTDVAIVLGLLGAEPETVDPAAVASYVTDVEASGLLALLGEHVIPFQPRRDIAFVPGRVSPVHPNRMLFRVRDLVGRTFVERDAYSVGGGTVSFGDLAPASDGTDAWPHPYASGADLLATCDRLGLSVAEVAARNEAASLGGSEVRERLLGLWSVMHDCVLRGCRNEGTLPGGLGIARRAPELHRRLVAGDRPTGALDPVDWLALWAMAVNEENAAGGRVVTAPTNGAAGILPAVLLYYCTFVGAADDDGVCTFLLTAGAFGSLVKRAASISGAEVGCQGEVGTAAAMAAAGLAAVLGGTPSQVENAAEIALEHSLGLTCDPVGGLVQVPCIERNAIGATKAVAAARLALHGDGSHRVSFDAAVETMRQTGRDMDRRYKETSLGGLAVNVVEC